MIRCLLILCAACPAAAQFSDLNAPGNGDDLYYALSFPSAGPVYRVGTLPPTLFAWSAPPVFPPNNIYNTNEPWYISPYYRISHPQFSRDVTVAAYLARRDCLGGLGCFSVSTMQTTVDGVPGQGTLTFPGKGWISGNGRYLLLQAEPSPAVDRRAVWVDLQTGARQTLPLSADFSNPSNTGRVIADDGTAVFKGLYLFQGTQVTQPMPSAASEPVIDAAAQTVVYTAIGPHRYLRVYHIATHQDTVLALANGDTYSPSLSADGKRVLFLSTAQWGTSEPPALAQLYRVNIDGTGFQELTSGSEPAGVQQYAASDDGQIAWYLTASGSLVKLDMNSGRVVRTVIRPAPVDLSPVLVPGSAVTLPGLALRGDVRVTLNGIPAPLLGVSFTGITVQVPAEIAAGQAVLLQVSVGAGTPEEDTVQASVIPVASRPVLLAAMAYPGDYSGQAIHQDWNGYVTPDRPAIGGEIVHFYGTGLGTASTAGLPACAANSLPAAALYLGPAPGIPGYYQLDVNLPAVFSATHPLENRTYDQMYLDCGPGAIAVFAIQPNAP